MTRPERTASPGEAGFVLIGVVIFVLALTIIGLSLFSLSSYEAQFLQRSINTEQAFQSAVGGVEHAKFVLCSTDSIEGVEASRLGQYVTEAQAWQAMPSGRNTAGPVTWVKADTVGIRITAEVDGQRRTVEASFAPQDATDFYSQLVTIAGDVDVRTRGLYVTTARTGTVYLYGALWQNPGQPVNLWQPTLAYGPESIIRQPTVLPPGDTRDFIAARYGEAVPAIKGVPNANALPYTLDVGSPGVHYFKSPDESDPRYSLFEGFNGIIPVGVRGIAVWLFPNGARFDYQPVIQGMGSGEDCLVIVAGPTGPSPDPDDPQAGIWFRGGIKSSIPVILVTSGKVLVWHDNNYIGGEIFSVVDDLAIYAESISLMGPETSSGGSIGLRRQTGGPLDTYFLPQLRSRGALPGLNGTNGHQLNQLAGEWRASAR